jgi:hypothetical protein
MLNSVIDEHLRVHREDLQLITTIEQSILASQSQSVGSETAL